MPYAVGYARFSSVKQGSGSSLERQQAMIAKWIDTNPEYKIFPKNFEDLGRSASKGDHLKHGFGMLLQAIELKEIGEGDVILVEAIDRIGRLHETKMISLIHQIVEAGVRIITLQDGAVYGPIIKADQIWLLVGKVQQAFIYSESLGKRIKESYRIREQMAKKGILPKRRTPIWLNSDGTLKDDIAEAMKTAFEDALSDLGERRILRRLKAKHPAFEESHPASVRKWLTNKTAIGFWREHLIYPPIVSQDLFYQVQKRFEEAYVPASAPSKHFLAGLVRCGNCGSNFQVKVNKYSPNSMHCSARSIHGIERCENGKSFPAPVLLHICYDTATLSMENALQNIELSKAKKKNIIIDGQLNEIAKKLQNLINSIEKYGPVPEFDNQINLLIFERRKLEDEKLYFTEDDTMNTTSYEDAWDYQYELIEEDPMRLNALLQSVHYQIKCYANGNILANTTGNELSNCTYIGYDRKAQVYKIQTLDKMHLLANREGSLTRERTAKFLQMLQAQRSGHQFDSISNKDIRLEDFSLMDELMTP
ncbi:recombinase family protein [Pseudomonas sp. ES4]|uniref:recombinase family protein n=1 Tax=Pseudomonas sp. ES4 TaxID=3424777 RepID=UPI003D350CE4